MDRKFYGVFVAGGSGSRMGSEVPKQFLELDGKTILQRTIERFMEAVPDMHVVTVLPAQHFQTWKDICIRGALTCPQILVQGGLTRFHSVRNALEKIPDGAIVSIHDGVRPLVSASLVSRMAQTMQSVPALIPVVPVVDTLRSKDPDIPSPDRSSLVAVQTPQMFWSELLKDAYTQAYDLSFTDDASVAERKKIPLTLTEGERCNIKITTPEDLRLAAAVISLDRF